MQAADRLGRRRLDPVGDRDEPGRRRRRPPRTSPSCPRPAAPPAALDERARVDAERRHQRRGCRAPRRGRPTPAAHPLAGRPPRSPARPSSARPRACGRRRRSPRPAGAREPRSEAGGEAQHLVLGEALGGDDVGQRRLALGQGAGLVDAPACRPWRSRSSASASRISTPACAPRPVATMIDIGVASPSAQGQAMISTLTAATKRVAERRARARTRARPAKASTATAITAGTNQAETRSASAWIGARLRCASRHQRDDAREHGVRADPLGAHHEAAGAVERAAGDRVARRLLDRHRLAGQHATRRPTSAPSTTTPSTGTASPGRTRSRSPARTASSGTSSSPPSADPPRGLRRQVEQRADRVAGRARARQLHHLPDQHQDRG